MIIKGTFTGTFNGTPGVFVGALDAPLEPLIQEIRTQINWLTREQLAEHLGGVSLTLVDRLRRTGKIPYSKVGGRVRFDRARVDEALSQRGKNW